MASRKKRVLFVTQDYPQITQTYVMNDIEALWDQYDVQILALQACDYPYHKARPYILLNQKNKRNVLYFLGDFAPDIIHAHYMYLADICWDLSRALNAPFTIRTHSFDVLQPGVTKDYSIQCANQDACLGVLSYPFLQPYLERMGLKQDKFIPCFPVIDYARFHDESPNGNQVMNMGAVIPKKNMEDFVTLSRLVPDRQFNAYAMGYQVDQLMQHSAMAGGRVNFVPPVEPSDMLPHYKRHEWLVYTASHQIPWVGWPMAVAEAQAAGVGVCMQNIRPDLDEYVGGAGFLFDTPEEAAEIVSQPYPQAMREKGFEVAKRSDIAGHLHLLTDLWEGAPPRLPKTAVGVPQQPMAVSAQGIGAQ